MEVTIQHLGDVKFEARTQGHRVFCDQPPDNGGSDAGMTPPEYLLVSLGTCAGFYAAQYLKARSLTHKSLEVKVSADKATRVGDRVQRPNLIHGAEFDRLVGHSKYH